MAAKKLNVAFVWHMHQPFYKDLVTGEYVLPWVRLHAIKDYYDIVAILDDFREIKQTFNLVPSLLEQIEEYVSGKAIDKHLEVSLKKPADLSHEDKVFMLQNFFMANWDTMVNPYKRYYELLLKRGRFVTLEEIKSVAKRFTDAELLDLQVWFNLTWFGHIYKTKDPVIKGLLEKGKYFTLDDKAALLKKQNELISSVIPKYKELIQRKQIEVTVTPYYHPILPLLIDTNSAKDAMPNIRLPQNRFRHPEDAQTQVNEAMKYATQLFGDPPSGMWPSEGSVSQEMIPIVAKAGFKWIATDEEILAMSLGRNISEGRALSSSELFKAYRVENNGSSLAVIFRDHNLSDLVGFTYSKWEARDAACDLMTHLNNIRESLPDDGKNYLVSIILDGENAWEYYKNNGWDFLSELYSKLSKDPAIRTVRVCDFIAENPPQDKIERLFSGSWINHNFRIWIGHEEDNVAWDYLAKARLALESSKSWDNNAWKELYITEGSDWCWWYGDDHSSENDETFDMLFRKHLKNIYHIIGKPVPEYLDSPIKRKPAIKPTMEPVDVVKPVIDGEITNYYEWLSAGFFDIGKLKGAMHQAENIINGIYYGFDINSFHIRLDPILDLASSEGKGMSFGVIVYGAHPLKFISAYDNKQKKHSLNIYRFSEDKWGYIKTLDSVGIKHIVEMSVPFSEINVKSGDHVHFTVVIERDGQELERWPRGGSISFAVPGKDFEEKQWSV